ncbi:putative ABC-type maltose transporter [Helianthus annuus]|uniref:ABC-type maltose transporter n=1 Tax=Helianthus annuus TaxID=4232 RepID=A0A251SNZ6_HELAN|nr:ABC transporter G family member 8 [Helianthus annuus]KAF5772293.1 putative ABC-type maltose transporter [Helianthus annuus]KAJ0496726.1 putative ABC-type maltose transporter [Helianthus annuus]KAJ0670283.1 putative ABC-type maltose transporter [Helianthus annuus]
MEEPPPPSSPPPSSPSSPPPPIKTYTLTATSISYTKTPTTTTKITSFLLLNPCISVTSPPSILQDISLTAYPSQILAIVGPSGAGKSTLLDILATRTAPTTGTLLLNSSPMTPSTYRKLSAYVPQHDYSLPVLTVSETFAFAARLLQPKTTQISTLVTSLVTELGLTHVAHTKLGHNLSGGERRRVSIGLSLLHDPGVLLLDEPTSGLDSTSAYTIMQTLKSIATARRRTIILSIHQPSFKLLTTIDRILLLSKGKVVHHGTLPSLQENLLSNGFTLPPQLNSLEYAMEILTQLPVTKPVTQTSPTDLTQLVGIKHDHIQYRSSRVEEIVALYGRFWKIIYRTKQLLLTNTLQALVVGLVLGTIYIDIGFDKTGVEKRFGLFAFTLTFLLSSTTETLPIFINERPILLRETSGGVYRLSSYLIANTLVFFPYLLAIAIIYSVSVYFLVGLCQTWQAFGYFVLVIWVIVLMANSFILFLSSIAPNYITGTSLVTILLAGFFLFSGYFISKESMPKYWLFMHYFSMYKYALDAMLINEYSCLTNKCMIWYDEKSQTCMMTGADVLEKKGLHENQRWINVYILIGFFVFYRVLCFFFLVRRVSRSKK